MIDPATRSSVSRWSCSVEPRPVAVMPSATKTTVNERQNVSAGITTLARSPRWSSASVTPETAER